MKKSVLGIFIGVALLLAASAHAEPELKPGKIGYWAEVNFVQDSGERKLKVNLTYNTQNHGIPDARCTASAYGYVNWRWYPIQEPTVYKSQNNDCAVWMAEWMTKEKLPTYDFLWVYFRDQWGNELGKLAFGVNN